MRDEDEDEDEEKDSSGREAALLSRPEASKLRRAEHLSAACLSRLFHWTPTGPTTISRRALTALISYHIIDTMPAPYWQVVSRPARVARAKEGERRAASLSYRAYPTGSRQLSGLRRDRSGTVGTVQACHNRPAGAALKQSPGGCIWLVCCAVPRRYLVQFYIP